tara:strand:- start:1478 stop:1885 length:408 start_codon:yes stop_codon:yes gene_type:complete
MNEREHNLLKIRPEIASARISENMSNEELFQNKTLRPILKLQNPLLLLVFKNYINKHKNIFFTLSLEKRFEYIENAIQKDIKFRNSLKGIIIGQFTIDEYELYIKNSSSLNKRMMSMVIERLKDQIQFFELEALV